MDKASGWRRWLATPTLQASALLHICAVVVLVLRPSTWVLVGSIVVADHVVVVGLSLWPRSRALGPNLNRATATDNTVYLTFDDGPDPEVTPLVLDELDRHDAKATFFCIGRRVEAHPELVREIIRRGHSLQNHTYRHSNFFWFYSPRALRRELARSQQVLAHECGSAPRYFRAPAGIRSPWLQPILEDQSLELVSWTRRGFDTATSNPNSVLDRLERHLGAGDILLLHDGSSVRDRNGLPVVTQTLPRLLESIRNAGLKTATLPLGSSR